MSIVLRCAAATHPLQSLTVCIVAATWMSDPTLGLRESSLFWQLRHSSAGRFQRACTDHGQTSCLSGCSQLPRIVTVGDAKVGKTCLLSRLTSCPIFYRNCSTTKMPVRVQMVQVPALPEQGVTVTFQGQTSNFTSVQQAAAAVDSIMQAADGICTEEILVTIKQVAADVLSASLVLPFIVLLAVI